MEQLILYPLRNRLTIRYYKYIRLGEYSLTNKMNHSYLSRLLKIKYMKKILFRGSIYFSEHYFTNVLKLSSKILEKIDVYSTNSVTRERMDIDIKIFPRLKSIKASKINSFLKCRHHFKTLETLSLRGSIANLLRDNENLHFVLKYLKKSKVLELNTMYPFKRDPINFPQFNDMKLPFKKLTLDHGNLINFMFRSENLAQIKKFNMTFEGLDELEGFFDNVKYFRDIKHLSICMLRIKGLKNANWNNMKFLETNLELSDFKMYLVLNQKIENIDFVIKNLPFPKTLKNFDLKISKFFIGNAQNNTIIDFDYLKEKFKNLDLDSLSFEIFINTEARQKILGYSKIISSLSGLGSLNLSLEAGYPDSNFFESFPLLQGIRECTYNLHTLSIQSEGIMNIINLNDLFSSFKALKNLELKGIVSILCTEIILAQNLETLKVNTLATFNSDSSINFLSSLAKSKLRKLSLKFNCDLEPQNLGTILNSLILSWVWLRSCEISIWIKSQYSEDLVERVKTSARSLIFLEEWSISSRNLTDNFSF